MKLAEKAPNNDNNNNRHNHFESQNTINNLVEFSVEQVCWLNGRKLPGGCAISAGAAGSALTKSINKC